LEENTQQLKTLAALALKHLEDRCPVCAQTYDKEATRLRLEAMAKGGVGDIQTSSGPDRLPELLAALAAKEKEAAAAELALRTGEQAVNERQIAQQTVSKRLSDLGVVASDEDSRKAAIAKAIAEADALIRRVAELQRVGESLALRLAQSSALATIDELGREAETLRRENADRERVVSARNQTGERAQRSLRRSERQPQQSWRSGFTRWVRYFKASTPELTRTRLSVWLRSYPELSEAKGSYPP
jgi:hypothetical protein